MKKVNKYVGLDVHKDTDVIALSGDVSVGLSQSFLRRL